MKNLVRWSITLVMHTPWLVWLLLPLVFAAWVGTFALSFYLVVSLWHQPVLLLLEGWWSLEIGVAVARTYRLARHAYTIASAGRQLDRAFTDMMEIAHRVKGDPDMHLDTTDFEAAAQKLLDHLHE